MYKVISYTKKKNIVLYLIKKKCTEGKSNKKIQQNIFISVYKYILCFDDKLLFCIFINLKVF